jgi:hypothetical protein
MVAVGLELQEQGWYVLVGKDAGYKMACCWFVSDRTRWSCSEYSFLMCYTNFFIYSEKSNKLFKCLSHPCPATAGGGVSLTNLQVTVGGQNVLQSTLFYTYENFLEQVNLAEQLTSADFGVSTALISQGYWEWSRWYYVNTESSQLPDILQPRNINVSYNNNSNVPIDEKMS